MVVKLLAWDGEDEARVACREDESVKSARRRRSMME